ncbi:hypothetical protein DFJ74DRAFT_710198 [Hyaloraphidium curvatum]|nr:hypothetical protein DFJ74DRAFT_710198 [Hyaloraphidium curvatum]
MANATSLPLFPSSPGAPSLLSSWDAAHLGGALASWGLSTPSAPLIDAFYSAVDFLSGPLGLRDWLIYVLVTTLPFKLARTLGVWFFLKADKEGWLERYRIQPKGKMPSDADTAKMYETQISNWLSGFLFFEMPMTAAFYLFRVNFFGFDIRTRDPGGWIEVLWRCSLATVYYDFWVWAWHVACHKVPWMYTTLHKHHHEFTAPNILVSAYFTLIDLLFETSFGLYFAHSLAGTTFFSGTAWMCFMTWIGIHNHCGFRCPWDVVNHVLKYVEYHDYHHESFNHSYQTILICFDWLFGYDKAFWVARKEKLAALAAREKAGKAE